MEVGLELSQALLVILLKFELPGCLLSRKVCLLFLDLGHRVVWVISLGRFCLKIIADKWSFSSKAKFRLIEGLGVGLGTINDWWMQIENVSFLRGISSSSSEGCMGSAYICLDFSALIIKFMPSFAIVLVKIPELRPEVLSYFHYIAIILFLEFFFFLGAVNL